MEVRIPRVNVPATDELRPLLHGPRGDVSPRLGFGRLGGGTTGQVFGRRQWLLNGEVIGWDHVLVVVPVVFKSIQNVLAVRIDEFGPRFPKRVNDVIYEADLLNKTRSPTNVGLPSGRRDVLKRNRWQQRYGTKDGQKRTSAFVPTAAKATVDFQIATSQYKLLLYMSPIGRPEFKYS